VLTASEPYVEEKAPSAPRTPGRFSGVDGLRGLAVLAVIAYHFATSWLPAGFLGVDMFFVVSGFLITRLLLSEARTDGGIRLRNFWARRARRLLPALTAMLAVVAVLALGRSSAAMLHDLRAQFVATLAYVANWQFIFGHTSYFGAASGPTPLLHVWSLAVEEQFYLVFPVLLFVWLRVFPRSRDWLAVVFVAGAVTSTILMALFYDVGDPTRVYFGTDTHAMGLLLGAALCVWMRADGPRRQRGQHASEPKTGAALVAFVAVVLCMRFAGDNSDWLYRGGFLAFSAAVCLVLSGVVRAPRSALGRAFASSTLVAIGLRSYSLYLWHWPVRVYVDESSTHLSGPALLAVRLLVLFIVAEVSYRLVEQPLRTGVLARQFGARPALTFSAIASIAVLALVAQMPTTTAPTTQSVVYSRPPVSSAKPTAGVPAAPASLRVNLFGDSTAFVLLYNIAGKLADVPEVTPGGETSLGCSIVPGNYYNGRVRTVPPDWCPGWQDRWRKLLTQRPADAEVLMSGVWDVQDHETKGGIVRFGTQAWHDLVKTSVEQAVDLLRSAGVPVFIMDAPCYTHGDWHVVAEIPIEPARVTALNSIFNEVAAERPGVQVLPFGQYVCPNGTLLGTLDGIHMWDEQGVHVSDQGTVALWHWLASEIRRRLPAH
jgi:peptidoglycan/LPS O-acetylase OafA/YrhL